MAVAGQGDELTSALEASCARLGTDHVDICHLHGVSADDYSYARDVLLPVLVRHRDRGTVRAIGITEAFISDTEHRMLRRAVNDACWDDYCRARCRRVLGRQRPG